MKNKHKKSNQVVEIMLIDIDKDTFAFKLEEIISIGKCSSIIKLPWTKEFCVGIMLNNGKFVFIIDLEKILGKRSKNNDEKTDMVAMFEYNSWLFGFKIFSCPKVISVKIEKIKETLPNIKNSSSLLANKQTIEINNQFLPFLKIEDLKSIFSKIT